MATGVAVTGLQALSAIQLFVVISAALLPLVVFLNKTWRFYMKYFLYNWCYMIMGVLVVPFTLIKPGDINNTRWPSLFVKHTLKYLFGIKLHLRHTERLELHDTYVIVCNHQSTIDHLAMMEIWPQRCTVIMKKTLKYAGAFGLAAILCGVIFVDRDNKSQANSALNDTGETMKKKKARVWIFPEGTRRMERTSHEPMLPFKKGAFNLAVSAQVPIVPVVFSSQSSFFSFKDKEFTRGEHTVTVLDPVLTAGRTLEDVPQLTEEIRQQMIDVFEETSTSPCEDQIEQNKDAKEN
ncbi:1-acyl-sn-glycerol-3-phosphate acyltransferase alpha-like [Ptychodera flava]|uniref:1-acyl-sn-glycerol-3-phosphate acyltransferase alpha-like n=1 Tax=Ptychodera flava TaxID=63121 RepID=UPI00396A30FF